MWHAAPTELRARRAIWDARALRLALQYHELNTAVWRQVVVHEEIVVDEVVARTEEVASGGV